jgi:lipoprotein-anchoring transpeptidase ErfK/SrfK
MRTKVYQIFSILIISISILFACGSKDNDVANNKAKNDSNPKDTIQEEPYSLNYPLVHYTLMKLNNNSDVNKIINKYKKDSVGTAYRKALRTLNRKELQFFRVGQSVIVPDSVIDDVRAYSIFPDEYKGAKDIEKIIVIDNEYQCYGCYEYGKLVRFAACNTGKEKTPTFPGRYSFVWKQRVRHSSLDSTWVMPFTFNFHQYAGNAMHQFSMPGRPVSHSCIRQFIDDAEWIYNWGKSASYDSSKKAIPHSGTPIIILNMFDYTRKTGGPWLEIVSNQSYKIQLPENPMEVEEALIPWCQIPTSSRGSIPNKARYVSAEDTLRARGIIKSGVILTETVNYNKLRAEKAKKKLADSIANNNLNNIP